MAFVLLMMLRCCHPHQAGICKISFSGHVSEAGTDCRYATRDTCRASQELKMIGDCQRKTRISLAENKKYLDQSPANVFSLRAGRLLIIILLPNNPPQVYLILSQMSSQRMRRAYNNHNHNNPVCYCIHTFLTYLFDHKISTNSWTLKNIFNSCHTQKNWVLGNFL